MMTTTQPQTLTAATTAFAYSLSERDMRYIFEELRKEIDASPRGDVGGELFEIVWKAFNIEARHRYQAHEERGGDHYCGFWETFVKVDHDYIEITAIWDEEGFEYPELVARLNDYARRNRL